MSLTSARCSAGTRWKAARYSWAWGLHSRTGTPSRKQSGFMSAPQVGEFKAGLGRPAEQVDGRVDGDPQPVGVGDAGHLEGPADAQAAVRGRGVVRVQVEQLEIVGAVLEQVGGTGRG